MKLTWVEEPELMFGHEQLLQDPRDGLTLFGPLDRGKPYGIRWGVVGTKAGIERSIRWVKKVQGPVQEHPLDTARPFFPGFEAAFGIPWATEPLISLEVANEELEQSCRLADRYQRVYQTVDAFAERIRHTRTEEDQTPDIWFIIIPDYVYVYCRPKSLVEPDLRLESKDSMPPAYARTLRDEPSLWQDENLGATPYYCEVHFHNQIKARLLGTTTVTQIIRESTIAHEDFVDGRGRPQRDLGKMQSAIAWNLGTTTFYKTGGRPWKIGTARKGVCYLGLVFKQDERSRKGPRWACCAAQMFLDSGDGVVFKGAVGPWYNPEEKTFHLKKPEAHDLVALALRSYEKASGTGKTPSELFIHGRNSIDRDEWEAFCEAADSQTKVIAVRIKRSQRMRLFRVERYPVLRGLACIIDDRSALLWTGGFVPRLQTATGLEVPAPLEVTISRGDADLLTVLRDILTLTKLNYNACVFGDGEPVTLKFADAVGEILTAGPIEDVPPLPFKYYI